MIFTCNFFHVGFALPTSDLVAAPLLTGSHFFVTNDFIKQSRVEGWKWRTFDVVSLFCDNVVFFLACITKILSKLKEEKCRLGSGESARRQTRNQAEEVRQWMVPVLFHGKEKVFMFSWSQPNAWILIFIKTDSYVVVDVNVIWEREEFSAFYCVFLRTCAVFRHVTGQTADLA